MKEIIVIENKVIINEKWKKINEIMIMWKINNENNNAWK